MKDVDFGSLAFRVLDSIQPFKYLTVLILPKSPSPYPKKFLELFLNRSKNPKNYFHAKPFGKSFNHIEGRGHFSCFRQKVKILMSLEKKRTFFCLSKIIWLTSSTSLVFKLVIRLQYQVVLLPYRLVNIFIYRYLGFTRFTGAFLVWHPNS